MSNEYKDWIVDENTDLRNCLCKAYKTLNTLMTYEIQLNEEPNEVIVFTIAQIQEEIEKTLGYTKKEIMEN